MLELLSKFYFILPLTLLLVTIGLAVRGSKKLRHGVECTGTITEFYRSTNSRGQGTIAPMISYTIHGYTNEFVGNCYWTSMRVGNKIKLLYDESDPSKVSIKAALYMAPMISGILTAFFTLPIIIFAVLKFNGIDVF